MTFAVALLWKSTVVLVAALVAVRLARRTRASVRHGLLVAAFALLALLPVGMWALPIVAVPVLPDDVVAVMGRSTDVRTGIVESSEGRGPTSLTREPAPSTGLSTVPEESATSTRFGQTADGLSFSPGTILGTLWAIGAATVLIGLIVGVVRVQHLRRTALPSREAHALLHAVAVAPPSVASVDVVVHEDIQSPFTCGVWRLSIVLPRDVDSWNEAAMRRALVHELEHLARHDWLTQISSRAICALYWFHPLAWIAYRQLCLEAEHACDDAVVAREEGTMYAEQLVTLARRMASRPAVAVLGMAQRSDLAARVSAVLDAGKVRGRAGLLRSGLITATAAAALLALAPLQLVAQGPPIADGRSPSADAGSPIADARTPVSDQRSPAEDADSPLEGASAPPRGGIDGQRRSARFERVLVEAADEGDIDAVRELLDDGANVNAAVPGDGSPLIAAARGGHIQIVRLLLDRGADVNQGVAGDGNPLIMAAREGHLEIIRLLVDRGANIEFIVPGDENALITASAEGRLDIVRFLVERGANVNAGVEAIRMSGGGDNGRGTSELRTPLGMAVRGGHRDVAEFLRANGATQ